MSTPYITGHDVDEATRVKLLLAAYSQEFAADAKFVVRAPGRINLIGEHTDYNGGFVLPAAIDRTVLAAVGTVSIMQDIDLFSVNFNDRTIFSPDDIAPAGDDTSAWSNYVRAVAWALGEQKVVDPGKLSGAQIAIEGNVPLASGLSSSAAIEVASALAFLRLAHEELDGTALALLCQKAENDFIGVKSGIMDQFISALGQPDSALLIDTRSLEYRVVPLGLRDLGYRLVAVDSAVPRSLITSAYNERKSQCEQAVTILAPLLGLGKKAQLRDINPAKLKDPRDPPPGVLSRRARHVVTEDARTLDAVALMDAGLGKGDNLARFGRLLYASHESLRDDYEVSSPELDLLVGLASEAPGVAGARMTGAGFGGCTVNIVRATDLPAFEIHVVGEYRRRTGLDAKIYVCEAVQGGSYIDI